MYTIKTLPEGLRTLARTWLRSGAPSTAKEREAVVRRVRIKDRGGLSIREARRAVDEALDRAREARSERLRRRLAEHLGYCPVPKSSIPAHGTPDRERIAYWTRMARRLAEPLHQRLDRLRTEAVIRARDEAGLRHGAAGGTSTVVRFTDDPRQVGYEVHLTTNRTTYRGRFKGWSAREDHHRITVPRDWRLRVERRGLAVVDGLLTLDAHPVEGAPQGVELFTAVWAEQGRGYRVHTRRGYIARSGDYAYHSGTPRGALGGLQRKLRRAREEAEWRPFLQVPDALFEARMQALGPALDRLQVSVKDARATGSCEYGIRSWCLAAGLDYEAGSATLREVLEAYHKRPVREARLAILHALRRRRVHLDKAA